MPRRYLRWRVTRVFAPLMPPLTLFRRRYAARREAESRTTEQPGIAWHTVIGLRQWITPLDAAFSPPLICHASCRFRHAATLFFHFLRYFDIQNRMPILPIAVDFFAVISLFAIDERQRRAEPHAVMPLWLRADSLLR